MSPALSTRFKRISRVLSIQTARSLHFLVLVWFLVFIVMHVDVGVHHRPARNLNHVYAGPRPTAAGSGSGSSPRRWSSSSSGWVAATPLHPPPSAGRAAGRPGASSGPLQRLFEHVDPKPGQYTEKDISPYFWHNGQYPDSDEYKALFDGDFADYRLRINGLVEQPRRARPGAAASAAAPRADHPALLHPGLVGHRQVGRRVDADDHGPGRAACPRRSGSSSTPSATEPDKGVYYDAHPIEQMGHHLTMLAYDMNDEPLPFGHGAPLRLRNEIELGFKQVKWIKGIEFVAALLRDRRRPRRLQPGPRVLRLPAVHLRRSLRWRAEEHAD